MKRDWVILVDNREKKPLKFPAYLTLLDPSQPPQYRKTVRVRLHTEPATLPTADYCLSCAPEVMLVERKGSIDEVAGNCLDPVKRKNFVAELQRLTRECSRPLLVMEGDPLRLAKTRYAKVDPRLRGQNKREAQDRQQKLNAECARSALIRLLQQHNIPLLLLPSQTLTHRAALAEWVATMMIEAALQEK